MDNIKKINDSVKRTCLYLLKNLNINLSQFYCLFDLSKDLIHSKVFAIQYSSVV